MSYTYYPHRSNAVIDQNTVNATGRCILTAFHHIMKKPDVLYAVLTDYLSLDWRNQDDVMQFEMALHHYVVQTIKNKVITRKSVPCPHGDQEFMVLFHKCSDVTTIFVIEVFNSMKRFLNELDFKIGAAGDDAVYDLGVAMRNYKRMGQLDDEISVLLGDQIDQFTNLPGYWHQKLYSELQGLDLQHYLVDLLNTILEKQGDDFFTFIQNAT